MGVLSYLLLLYVNILVCRLKERNISYCIRPVMDLNQNSDGERNLRLWALAGEGSASAAHLNTQPVMTDALELPRLLHTSFEI